MSEWTVERQKEMESYVKYHDEDLGQIYFDDSTMKVVDVADMLAAISTLTARAEAAEARAERLKTALMLILDCADYTSGACGLTEMIGGVLPRQIIDRARDALKGGEG